MGKELNDGPHDAANSWHMPEGHKINRYEMTGREPLRFQLSRSSRAEQRWGARSWCSEDIKKTACGMSYLMNWGTQHRQALGTLGEWGDGWGAGKVQICGLRAGGRRHVVFASNYERVEF